MSKTKWGHYSSPDDQLIRGERDPLTLRLSGSPAARPPNLERLIEGLKEARERNPQGSGQCRETFDRHGRFPPFDLAHVCPVEARPGGELFLRQPRLRSAEIAEALAHGTAESLGFRFHCRETVDRCTIVIDIIEEAILPCGDAGAKAGRWRNELGRALAHDLHRRNEPDHL